MIDVIKFINSDYKNDLGNICIDFLCVDKNGNPFDVSYIKRENAGEILLCGKGKSLEDTISLSAVSGGVVCRRTVKNVTSADIFLKELSAHFSGLDFGGDKKDDYYYSIENHRLFNVYTLPLDFDRLNDNNPKNNAFGIKIDKRWNDPGAINDRILNSPYQAFPAIHLGNYKSSVGLVHGTLSQDVFFHNYQVGHDEAGAYLSTYSSFKSISYRVIKSGEQLTDVWYFGITEHADDINVLFDGYTSELRKYLTHNRAKSSVNKNEVVWGSWNDGIYRDVSESLLVGEAKALRENFPSVKWVQLDDGYATLCMTDVNEGAHGLGVVYEGEDGVDKKKFPNGLRGYVEKIKETGLRPSVWIGGLVPHKAKLYKEKPEWFLDYSYRIDTDSPLDVSIKEAREYMVFAMNEFICKFGFEGVKHDFWSYAFEDGRDLLKNKDKSGYEYRKWWLNEIRKRLPEYGYMQTGCDVGMGNPFLGEFFDNYRFGLDVGSGKWENVKATLFWGCACFATHTGDLFIPNGDSIGLMKGLDDTDFYFLLNYLLITHSLVELSGVYSDIDVNDKRLKILKRATKGLNNGANVYFAKFNYRERGAYIPQVFYTYESCFDDVGEKLLTIAVFNPGEEEIEVKFSARDLRLDAGEYEFKDVWNGDSFIAEGVSVRLKAHQSKLYYVI